MGQLVVGQGLQRLGVGLDLCVVQQHGAHQDLGAFAVGHGFQLLGGDVVVVGKAHRNVVFVLVNVILGGFAPQRPALELFLLPAFVLVLGHQRVAHTQQAAQGVVFGLRLGVDVPLDPDIGIKLHNRGGDGRVEKLQAGAVEPQPQIVVRAVGVQPVKVVIGQSLLHFLHRIVGLRDQVTVVLPLGVLAQRKMHRAVHKAEPQNPRQQDTAPAALVAGKMPQKSKQNNTQQRHAPDAPEAGGFVGDAKDKIAVLVLVGHQRKGGGAERDQQNQPPRRGYFFFCQMRARERICRCSAQNQNGHIVPAGIIAGIQGVERAVQHRHKGADNARFEDVGERVAALGAHKRQPTRQPDQRQVGGHTGVL